MPVAKIARQLGFCRQTIYNELKRGLYVHTCDYWDEVRYSADKGQQKHDYMQTGKGRPLKLGNHRDYADYLEHLIIKEHYSPAAALAKAKAGDFSICVRHEHPVQLHRKAGIQAPAEQALTLQEQAEA